MEDTRPEIYLMNADGKNKARVTYNDFGDTLPSWSRDNKKILITGYRNGNFQICELNLP
jgi:Tol biopolymer transport system component